VLAALGNTAAPLLSTTWDAQLARSRQAPTTEARKSGRIAISTTP
jgi:hypothetical protein